MQIIDYTKRLRKFNNLELSILDLLIKEFLEKDSMFDFLKEVDLLHNFDILWYRDSNGKAMAGYQMMMNRTIYVASNFVGTDEDFLDRDGYDQFAFNRVATMLSSIIHEAYHYYQHKFIYKYKYILLQLPIIRDHTIEKEAYAISDYIDKLDILGSVNQLQECLLKIKYKFQESYFFGRYEKDLRDIIISRELNPMDYYHYDGLVSSLIKELK